MIGASTFTSFIQQDVPTIEALNAAGLDVSSVGNHEFDQGFADLTDRVMPLALWEYLGANIYEKGTTDAGAARVLHPGVRGRDDRLRRRGDRRAALAGQPGRHRRHRRRRPDRGGQPRGRPAQRRQRRNGEADIVVLLVHEGAATTTSRRRSTANSRFGEIVHRRRTTNVDAIVSGHTHLAYNHVVTVDGRELPVISSGQYGERFSRMDIQYDKTDQDLHDEERDLQPDGRRRLRCTRTTPRSKPIVDEAVKVANELGNVVLGTATAASVGPWHRAPGRRPVVPREPRRRVDARQLRGRRAAVGAQRRTALATWTSRS